MREQLQEGGDTALRLTQGKASFVGGKSLTLPLQRRWKKPCIQYLSLAEWVAQPDGIALKASRKNGAASLLITGEFTRQGSSATETVRQSQRWSLFSLLLPAGLSDGIANVFSVGLLKSDLDVSLNGVASLSAAYFSCLLLLPLLLLL